MFRITIPITLLAALVLGGSVPAAELVARYALDGNADDSSGNSFHGTDDAGTTAFVNDPERGMVALFDGSSSSIDVSASGYSITERPHFEFALSFWFKPTERDDYRPGGLRDLNPIMGAINSGVIEVVGDHSWHGMGGVSAYGGLGVNSGGGAGSVAAVAGVDVYDGDWHHVVIQWQDPDGVPSDVALGGGADATIYIDNQLAEDVNSQVYNGNSGQAAPRMVLGGQVVYSDGGPADKYYNGLLSDVRFFDAQLTAEEVDGLFNGGSASLAVFAITSVVREDNGDVTLTWNSRPGESYTIHYSGDMVDFSGDVGDDFEAAADGTTTSATFENPLPGSARLFVRIARNP